MGILDDAIREHLELKRRHGVAEEEVQRQEEEALGPARREVAQQHEETELAPGQPATAQAAENGGSAEEQAPTAAEDETALFDMEVPAGDAAPSAEPAPVEPAPVEPPPVEPPPVEAAVADDEALVEEEPAGEPAHEPDPHHALGETQPHGFEAIEGEDEEAEPYDRDPDDEEMVAAEDDSENEDEDEDQDVLEDTPDFLHETPEHDRLWFEQKPPRDFDFD